jgi:carboxypeptidase Q
MRQDKKLAGVCGFTTMSAGLRFCDLLHMLSPEEGMKNFVLACTVLVAASAALPLGATGEKIDYEAINKIRQQGLNPQTSQVMEISSWLTDVHGPRLTGSANVKAAGEWAVGKMKEWGLQNVALEPWADKANQFAYGWTNDKFYLAAVSPQAFPIPGTPVSWTPGTDGLVRGEVVLVTETTQEDLQKYAGKLKGKWILGQAAPDVAAFWNPPATRTTAEELQRMELASNPAPEFGVANPNAGRGGQGGRGGFGQGPVFNRNDWFKTEGAAGLLSTAPRGHGAYTIGGGDRNAEPTAGLPRIAIPAEQYGRLARMAARNIAVTIEADIKNTYTPNPPMFNVVGEIPGTDKADEIVMLGAHFDSWHASTGATDNAAGSAAMMEAMRILKQSGLKMRRTVRIGLWTGEEQGLIGSRDYVKAHFGSCNDPSASAPGGATAGRAAAAAPAPQRGGGRGGCQSGYTFTPAHAKFAGYFNIDNGTGAIRGVYLQQNDAVGPIFREWMEPFRSIGMSGLTIRNTGGTDHQSFDALGLPGFQFIQDEIEYDSMTHHTNLDSYERLQPGDMMKNATIAAAFAYLTANRDERLPRKSAPQAVAGRGTGQ